MKKKKTNDGLKLYITNFSSRNNKRLLCINKIFCLFLHEERKPKKKIPQKTIEVLHIHVLYHYIFVDCIVNFTLHINWQKCGGFCHHQPLNLKPL